MRRAARCSIDTDAAASTVAAALRLRAGQGLSGLVNAEAQLARGRAARLASGATAAIDVVPTGPDAPPFRP